MNYAANLVLSDIFSDGFLSSPCPVLCGHEFWRTKRIILLRNCVMQSSINNLISENQDLNSETKYKKVELEVASHCLMTSFIVV